MVTRINGFSGMDIDSMVKSMMNAKRVPLDKLNQQKQILQWTREGYREVNSKLYDFRTNKLGTKYGVSAAMNTQKAVTSGDTDALKAEAKAGANGIDMKVSITRLATYTTVKTDSIGIGKTGALTLGELDKTDTSNMDAEEKATYEKNAYKLTINKVSFEGFTKNTTISSMISTINADTKANVVASFDEVTGQLLIRSKVSGNPVQPDPDDVVPADEDPVGPYQPAQPAQDPTSTDRKVEIGADSKVLSLFGGITENKNGLDARVIINNQKLLYKSNNISVNGVDLTLQKTTSKDNPVFIKTQADPQKALDTIKGFIEDYNSLITSLNAKINEAKYRDFQPLTDDQKKDMKEDDIKTWTEKAKSGLFKNNDIISPLLTQMRGILTEKLGPLSSLGITTGNYMENGKLVLDEEKFKNAVNANPQTAIDLFQGPANAPKEGIFRKMQDKITSAIEKMSDRAGTNRFSMDLSSAFKDESVMGRTLKDYNNRIATLMTNLNNTEDRYYKQFSAMEKAMSKLTAQSSSLLSGLGK
ncbi:flagellar filament capping protein FliD [Paenibacillus sp. GCM10012306]|uniref:flagellar filament capping protein FliD n=1 Tax=Paenibacillus sp. GCM10012306 TaxID=3317342 RepID=UPI00361F2A2C